MKKILLGVLLCGVIVSAQAWDFNDWHTYGNNHYGIALLECDDIAHHIVVNHSAKSHPPHRQ